MNLVNVLYNRSRLKFSGITFVRNGGQDDFLSYNALYNSALRVLSSLQKKGMMPKTELVLQIEDNKDFLIVFWACILGGIIPVPLSVGKNENQNKKLLQVLSLLKNPFLIISRASLKQLDGYLKRSGSVSQGLQIGNNLIFVDDVFSSFEKGNVYRPTQEDIALIQFSSGSTGNPKGIVLTHANLIANIRGITQAASYSGKDRMLSWMPLTHDMGMIGFHLNPMFCGLSQYLMPTNLFIRNPRLWLDKISEHKISITCSPNFGYRYFLKYLKENQNTWDLSSVRIIYNGAEPISNELCQEFNERLSGYGLSDKAMCPVYGLAEASVAVSISGLNDKVQFLNLTRDKLNMRDKIEETAPSPNSTTIVNVGKPIDSCLVQITDKENQPLDENTIGQIKIKGTNVTSGYYNNISASKEVIDDKGWLNTGDLGFIKEGSLYITGRARDVIFINGQNYYAHDIEKEAESIEGIELNKIAVSSSYNAESQKEEIIAFLFHRAEPQSLLPIAQSLKRCINDKFGFELHKIIPVKDIPRTTSGKLQRFELLNRYKSGEFQQVEKQFSEFLDLLSYNDIVPPSNEVEEKLLRIWEEVLQSKNIGVEQEFFQIGGDSLKVTELNMKLQHELQVELPIQKLYEFQTIRKLAPEILNLEHKEYKPIPKVPRVDSYAVSSSQRRIYYAWKIDPDSIGYNMPVAIELKGKVNYEKLEECLRNLIMRHDALRMTFYLADEPRFYVSEELVVNLKYFNCARDKWEEKLRELVIPFDLSHGPLFRFFLLHDEERSEYVLLLDFHHIVSDGQSTYCFIEELLQAYNEKELPPVYNSFRDFVIWEQQQGIKVEEAVKKYWIDKFSDVVPLLEMPYDFSRPAILNGAGKRLQFELNHDVFAQLKEICKKHKVSTHSLFFTLYNILLTKYSVQEDIIIGIPVLGRKHPDLQRMQGMFVNNLPIRNPICGDYLFTDLLKSTFSLINETIANQDLGYDDLVNFLNLPSHVGRTPLFDTMFMYQSWKLSDRQNADVGGKRYAFDPGFSKFDISMEVFETEDQVKYAIEYSTQLFKNETILALSVGFKNIIHKVIDNPAIKIANLSPLCAEEFQNFIHTYNTTSRKTKPFITVQELFEEQVQNNPNNVAIEFEGKEFSYAELDISANQVACALRNRAIKKGDLVGIHLKRSPELIITILGILKAGAAYLPLEIGMPLERIKFILADSGCRLLVNDFLGQNLDLDSDTILDILAFDCLLNDTNNKCSLVKNSSTDLVYVIYTSGTTGQPKGVMIEHRSLSNYIIWASEKYIGEEQCSFVLYSSISFDLTVTSIFTPLVTGNKMIIYGEDDTEVAIEKVVRDDRADVIKLTPSHLRILKEHSLLSSATKIKKFIVGGEVLDAQLARDVYAQVKGGVEIFNEYGPTEATVGCMIYKFDLEDFSKTVSIGRPIMNTQIYLLDKYLKPVPANVPGEIHIGGEGLARGYLFREVLTNEKFVENPYIKGEKIYKTGDIAKRLPNGSLEYIGRNDQQIKINGNRVELSEIENQLIKFPNVDEAVVLVDSKNPHHILAYLKLLISASQFSDISLRNYLAERLPYFMIPKQFILVESMPLTRNGKLDIEKLRSIESVDSTSKKEGPKNDIERAFRKIWMSILNMDEIGIRDNFFELGGDSIKAVQISSRLFEEGILVKVKDILTYHTIENISRYSEIVNSSHQNEQGIVEGEFAPTPIQSWFFSRGFEMPNYFNQSVLLKANSPLDKTILERTFKALINHHDTLRVNYDYKLDSFFYNNKHLLEKIVVPEFHVDDDQTLSCICNELRDSFNISKSLLIKIAIIKKQDDTTFLFITAHHLIMDGISWRIFLEDFYQAYLSISGGGTVSFPQKTASFKDWSTFLNQQLWVKQFEKERQYWEEIEQNSFRLPQDIAPNYQSIQGAKKIIVSLEKEMTEFLLKGAHKPYNTDVLILLNAALMLTLKDWTGLEEFVIEQENHGRHSGDLNTSRTIGWFTAMYPIKLVYRDEIGALIKSVKETVRKVPNNGIGYGMNQFLTNKQNQTTKLSEVRLNYLGQFGVELNNKLMSLSHDFTGIEISPRNIFTSKLELNSFVTNDGFHAEIICDPKIFKESTANWLAKSFIVNLSNILLHLKNDDNLHFTPSDFTEVDLDEEEIKALFGDS